MNERIKQLLELSTYDVLGVKQVDQNKFARLIVEECIFIVDEMADELVESESTWTALGAVEEVSDRISEQFGVDE